MNIVTQLFKDASQFNIEYIKDIKQLIAFLSK